MKKILKWVGILTGILLLGVLIIYLIYNQPLPKGEKGPAADALAQKMLKAVNREAWDSTHILQWSFADMHHYLWDKKRNLVQIKWNDNIVLLNPDQVTGQAWEDNEELPADRAEAKVKKAWGFWCNDSFWFNAVVKCFDPGTSRSIVKTEDGNDALPHPIRVRRRYSRRCVPMDIG